MRNCLGDRRYSGIWGWGGGVVTVTMVGVLME